MMHINLIDTIEYKDYKIQVILVDKTFSMQFRFKILSKNDKQVTNIGIYRFFNNTAYAIKDAKKEIDCQFYNNTI